MTAESLRRQRGILIDRRFLVPDEAGAAAWLGVAPVEATALPHVASAFRTYNRVASYR